jgi:hypothetical protein
VLVIAFTTSYRAWEWRERSAAEVEPAFTAFASGAVAPPL